MLAVESLVAGLLEAAILVLVVGAALSVAGDSETAASIPLSGGHELAAGAALGLAAAFGVCTLVVHLHIAHLTARQSAGVQLVARDRTINAFTDATWARQSDEREGAIQDAVSTLSTGAASVAVQLSQFLSASLALVALLGAAILVDPLTTVAVMVFGLLLFAGLRPLSKLTRSRSQRYVESNSSFVESVSEWTALSMELRTFGASHVEARRLSEQNRVTFEHLAKARFMSRAGSALYRDVAMLFLVAAVALLYLTDSADVADVGAVVLLIVRALSYAQNANVASQGLHEASPNLDLLSSRLEALEAHRSPDGERTIEVVGKIELHDVGYSYGAGGEPAIHGISFVIEPGEAVGIIGPSGGGKTTLTQVLLRLREPTEGPSRPTALPYGEITEASWRERVALVPQEPRLFRGSIADNIRFFRAGSRTTRSSRRHRPRTSLTRSDDCPKGSHAAGTRARASPADNDSESPSRERLVANPRLLVLDEPTSALDRHSEERLKETIVQLRGTVTMVIVAHRLTTLAACDKIIGIERGRVTTIGSLPEVLASLSSASLLPESSASK